MLQKAALKISLAEPKKKLLDMVTFLKNFGTSQVVLVHVRTSSNYRRREEAAEQLSQLAKEVADLGLTVETTIRTGHAPTMVMEAAENSGADYVAIFWQPKALLRQALIGSIDSDILRMSNLPVFVYNPKLFKPVVVLDSVLYATDFKFTDAVVMPYLVNSRFKAHQLYLLHVGERAPDPVTEKDRKQNVLDNLQRLANECAHAYDQVEVIETIGMVRRQIIRQAKSKGVDLIVVGKSEKPDTLSRIIGSTAEILPHKARCNVFIIPGICSISAS